MPPLTPDALVYDVAAAADPQVSPDGTHVAFTVARADRDQDRGTSQVWLARIDGSDARRLTWSGNRNLEPRWSPDGAWLAFTSDRFDGSTALMVLPQQGPGEARELTRHRTRFGQLAWSPDGRSIAYTAAFDPDNPDDEAPPKGRAARVRVTRRLDYKQDNRGYLNDMRAQVFVVDTASGERRMLTCEPHDLGYPQWSPDGRWLAARVSTDN